jgi:hypothetical protein
MSDFDLKQGRAGRDEGMARVIDHNLTFKDQFARFVDHLPRGWIGTCEDIRQQWLGLQPDHPNAWGACWNAAKKRGQLLELPSQVHMNGVKAHARKTHLYRRV